jgi:hypothetical protein
MTRKKMAPIMTRPRFEICDACRARFAFLSDGLGAPPLHFLAEILFQSVASQFEFRGQQPATS